MLREQNCDSRTNVPITNFLEWLQEGGPEHRSPPNLILTSPPALERPGKKLSNSAVAVLLATTPRGQCSRRRSTSATYADLPSASRNSQTSGSGAVSGEAVAARLTAASAVSSAQRSSRISSAVNDSSAPIRLAACWNASRTTTSPTCSNFARRSCRPIDSHESVPATAVSVSFSVTVGVIDDMRLTSDTPAVRTFWHPERIAHTGQTADATRADLVCLVTISTNGSTDRPSVLELRKFHNSSQSYARDQLNPPLSHQP